MVFRLHQLNSYAFSLFKKTAFWKKYGWILRECRPSIRLMALSILFSFVAACAAALSTGFIGALLQGLTNPQGPPLQTGLSWIDTQILGSQDANHWRVYRLAGVTLLSILVQTAATYWGQLNLRFLAVNLVDRLRARIFDQLQAVSLSFFQEINPGNLIDTITNEVNYIQQAFISFSNTLTQIFVLLGYACAMVFLSWKLSLAIVLILGLLSVGLQNARRQVGKASFLIPRANQNFAAVALEAINGMMTIHACNAQTHERRRYQAAAQEVLFASRRMTRMQLRVPPITQSIASSLLIALIVVSYELMIRRGMMQGTTLIAFLFAMSRALPMVVQVSNARVNAISLQGSLHSISTLLEVENKPYFVDGSQPFDELSQGIDFVHVTFAHQPNHMILHDINLSFMKGQTTALVGSSGSGKTTIANLLLRFFDPAEGQVLVDGIDVRDLRIDTLRNRMAIVSQDTFIFNTSVRENIAYGLPQCSEEALIHAAEQANALDFIRELPAGFDTILGDRGLKLSGGQRQRIAIARAILRNPDILILDEATSALDSVTEQKIQEALTNLSKGRTVIVIAHRLSTIANADQIYVLEQGQVVENGTLASLLELQGKFWQYYQKQSSPTLTSSVT